MSWTNQKWIAFRATQDHVTDPANQTSLNEDPAGGSGGIYPHSVTIDGDTFDIGFPPDDTLQWRDRTLIGGITRLAGIGFCFNNGANVKTFQADVPPGLMEVRIGAGDPSQDRPYIEWAVYDDDTLLDTIVIDTNTPATAWRDAEGTLFADGDAWAAGNVGKIYNIASGILFIKIGSVTEQTDVSPIATIGLRQPGEPPAGGRAGRATLLGVGA
jgi:hypothetical protein